MNSIPTFLFSTLLFQSGEIKVYTPDYPRGENQFWVALEGTPNPLEISSEQWVSLQKTTNQIVRLLREKNLASFIGYVTPPHKDYPENSFVIEISPCREDSTDCLNVFDKIDANLHLFYRYEKVPLIEPNKEKIEFWKGKLEETSFPDLPETVYPEEFVPWDQRQRNYLPTLNKIYRWLERDEIPIAENQDLLFKKEACTFCNPEVIHNQFVKATEHFHILMNYKPTNEEGHCLIVSKRHVHHIENLTGEEVVDLRATEQKLIRIFAKKGSVVVHAQNDPPAGQTVAHFHSQVILLPGCAHQFLEGVLQYEANLPLTREQMERNAQEIRTSLENL